ncbi:MAG: S49 family peptidase, partial [Cyclobacteriaceae bacterium]|nr:S49 family peptidase [Cyclobacteriaceae bacterium]
VNKGYDTFIQRVADGRKTDKEKILAVASGRVWSGLQALDNGLVDALGGLETAITMAANAADLDDYKIVEYPGKRDLLEEFLNMNKPSEDKLGVEYFGEYYFTLKKIKNLAKYQGVQARIPFELTIE